MPRTHVLLLLACAIPGAAPLESRPASPAVAGKPAGLAPATWSGILEAYQAGEHRVLATAEGYRSHSPGQRWTTRFDGRGFLVSPDAGGWSWGLELVSWGRSADERMVARPQRVSATEGRVDYAWNERVTEWYVNDRRGLEHGFTVYDRPLPGQCGDLGPLLFTLAVRGSLVPEIVDGARSVRFKDAGGTTVLEYAGLVVYDADSKELPARFEHAVDRLLLSIDDEGARYPLTVDPVAQQMYLKSSNTSPGDAFGWSVAASGDTLVVGAPNEESSATGVNGAQNDEAAPDSGAVYVFVQSSTGWIQQAYLKASNTGAGDRFGWSVAISGDTLVVGADREDSHAAGVDGEQNDNSALDSGAAFVFVRNGTSWHQEAYLKPSNTDPGDQFGWSVTLSADTAVVGAFAEDSSATGVNGNQGSNSAPTSGSAYVFERTGTSWTQNAYLKASNAEAGDFFGHSVSVSGDTLVVGAFVESSQASGVNGDQDDNSAVQAGAAYVFVRDQTTWSQQAYLKASNTQAWDGFGWSVAADGDTLVVGARSEDSNATGINGNQSNNNAGSSGAVYVFVRNGVAWSQEAYVKASNTGSLDYFGTSVALSHDALVVGAFFEFSNATGVGGDPTSNSAPLAGAAYLFERAGGSWSQLAYLKASNTDAGDNFGVSVALSGGIVIVGSWAEASIAQGGNGNQASNAAPEAGAAYVFQRCPEALVVFRNGGLNPASYAASPVVLGDTFTATVDNNLASQLGSVLFAFDTPTSFPLSGGQVLLCLDQGGGEIFTGLYLTPSSSAGGIDSYSLLVPDNPLLAGFTFCSQALQFGNRPFVFSNAQDLTIGHF